MAAAITGSAALLQASGVAFEIFKLLGVAYLLNMAWSAWRDQTPLVLEAAGAERSSSRVIGSAVLANLLNPKLTLFLLAFLPQFTRAHCAHRLADMLMLSVVFMAIPPIVFVGYGVVAAGARRYVIEPPVIVRSLRRTFALSFVALSARLASETR
jgi:threonine/homoserine/homoserine lactone efflux protein